MTTRITFTLTVFLNQHTFISLLILKGFGIQKNVNEKPFTFSNLLLNFL